MKQVNKILLIVLFIVSSTMVFGQNIEGQWNGMLDIQGMKLRLVFNITKTETGLSATMDSPDQGAKGIPVTSVSFENNKLKITIASAAIEYTAELIDSTIFKGTFNQGGYSFPLDMAQKIIEKPVVVKVQDPKKPYPYYEENIRFENKNEHFFLAGTLTLPAKEGSFPAVVLISGSGPQDRNEEIFGHKPFLIIADFLTRNGIAVLRFDDRGTAKSEGDLKNATSMNFADDVEFALEYLKSRKEINSKQIGLIGHSEGGIIAPIVAARSKDVSFIILLAGTGIPGNELLLLQQELISKAMGISEEEISKNRKINKGAFDIVLNSTDNEKLASELTEYIKEVSKNNPDSEKPAGLTEDEYIKMQVDQLTSPWMIYFIKYNPYLILKDVKCPVLALNGEKDLQVPPKENLQAIKKGLFEGGNKNVVAKELPGLNHLFQECITGAPSEYAQIEQTFSPVALDEMLNWIKNQLK
ncbi:MAG: alpha/beta hydrolase family protein [Bacteroidales bacterium]